MNRLFSLAALGMLGISFAAYSQNVDYNSLNQAGFGDVGELLKSMTPEQQQAVLKAAAVKQQDLQNMSPEERQQLQTELRKEADTIKMDQIDPDKLNTSKVKSTDGTMKDLDTYQTKYDQGKINNSAVKSPDTQ